LHHNNAKSYTSFFTRKFFYQKQHDCRLPSILLVSASPIEDKVKGQHFETTELIEAETEVVLNTLTEHDFQKTISKVMVAIRPKVGFWPDGSTSPGNYGWLFLSNVRTFMDRVRAKRLLLQQSW
jgi:hypothetical protein